MLNKKYKIPNLKHQIANKFQASSIEFKTNLAKKFVLDIWILVLDIVCDLRFGVWNLYDQILSN